MRDYLVPVFQLLFYASIIVFVAGAYRWRDKIYSLKGHLFLVNLALPVLALFFLSRGVAATSLGKGATLLILGGAVLFAGMLVQALAIHNFIKAGSRFSVGGSN
jgi:hypothetical protein